MFKTKASLIHNQKTFTAIVKVMKLCGVKFTLIPLLALLSGLLDAVSILLIGPIFKTFNDQWSSDNVLVGKLNSLVESFFEVFHLSYNQTNLLIALFFLLCLRSFFIYLTLLVTSFLRAYLLEILRIEFLKAFSKVKYEYFSSKTTGFYSNILNEQTTRTLQAFYFFSQALAFLLLALGYTALLISISWKTALISAFGTMVMAFPFFIINKKLKDWSRQNSITSGEMISNFNYIAASYKYLLATQQTFYLRKKIGCNVEKLRKIQFKNGNFAAITIAMREPIGITFLFGIFFIFDQYNGLIGSEKLIAVLLLYRFFNSVITFQSNLQLMNENVGALELVDGEINSLKENSEIENKNEYQGFTEHLKFEDVYFKYESSQANSIQSASFTIAKNQSVILIGESGSGKSTICNMLTRLIEPNTGSISVDGSDYNKFNLRSFRERIGYVSQESVFFNGTILDNICMGWDISCKDSSRLERARNLCESLGIHKFISKQELGYYTLVGENGMKLSGGQRQRICIARELYRQPEILILDEATSALDDNSSLYIHQYLATLKGKITIVSISHKLNNLHDYDKVVLVGEGTILAEGNYDDLLQNSLPFQLYLNNSNYLRVSRLGELPLKASDDA
ncbi:ABC transporter ATP-binding protein/permease [Alphaproteobacteria bacterium]|nr:ABC transporter ATP-binding protein/permease [Alphaproteobacteria bacterium]